MSNNELARQHVMTFTDPAHEAVHQEDVDVNALTMKTKPGSKFKDTANRMKINDKELFTCKRCGEKHRPRQWPAFGKTCAKCKGQHHHASMCL